MRRRNWWVWIFAISGGWPLSGEEPAKLRVLTTLAPFYSWAVSVTGDAALVENLLPAEVGPHHFQFRPRDLQKVQAADVIVLNGLGLESWLERMLTNAVSGGRRPRLVRTTDGLEAEFIYHLPELTLDPTAARTRAGHDHEHDHAAAGEPPNPHLWLDPVYARHGVSNILSAVCERDPGRSSV